MLNKKNFSCIEKYSSAITLSDMEIFIFPELIFSLVLANIMSPIIWKWKKDPWFKDIEKLNVIKKIQRIKQYIINNYVFNLDLETWGLTTKEKEIDRFKDIFDKDIIFDSNALFGYEGDKYYFNINIRKHFGLDKYKKNIIPYWKTETIEAMDAFKRITKKNNKGAGECVSFSALYCAALFIIGKISLKNIFIMSTPLHSQNFIDIEEGIITNNRRLITKNMWFNGTEISTKARRAIENEKIISVSNIEGYIHSIHKKATMSKKSYDDFLKKISKYLKIEINNKIIANFLRNFSCFQKFFQIEHKILGKIVYIKSEKAYSYEHGSPYLIGTNAEKKLLNEIDMSEFYKDKLKKRMTFQDINSLFYNKKYLINDFLKNSIILKKNIKIPYNIIKKIIKNLFLFCNIKIKAPLKNKEYIKNNDPIILDGLVSRNKINKYLLEKKEKNEIISLAFISYRYFDEKNIHIYIKTAIERNPISLEKTKNMNIDEIFNYLISLENKSIYSENRLAQPDEVFNFLTGDGLEKAISLLSISVNRNCNVIIEKKEKKKKITVIINRKQYFFISNKKVCVKKIYENKKRDKK